MRREDAQPNDDAGQTRALHGTAICSPDVVDPVDDVDVRVSFDKMLRAGGGASVQCRIAVGEILSG